MAELEKDYRDTMALYKDISDSLFRAKQIYEQNKLDMDSLKREAQEEVDAINAQVESSNKGMTFYSSLSTFLFFALMLYFLWNRQKEIKIKAALEISIKQHDGVNTQLEKANTNLDSANSKLKKKNARLIEEQSKLVALMRELNHRTINNLNEISSLLFLQATRMGVDTEAGKVLLGTRNRIITIGLIHRQLYRENKGELIIVNIITYVEKLIVSILKDYSLHGNVKTELSLDDIRMEMDVATSIGLVINELLQNSFKHGFAEVSDPFISVQLSEASNVLTLRVENNGLELPEGFSLEKNAGFGLELVTILLGEERLKFGGSDSGGAFFEVIFPVKTDNNGVVTAIVLLSFSFTVHPAGRISPVKLHFTNRFNSSTKPALAEQHNMLIIANVKHKTYAFMNKTLTK